MQSQFLRSERFLCLPIWVNFYSRPKGPRNQDLNSIFFLQNINIKPKGFAIDLIPSAPVIPCDDWRCLGAQNPRGSRREQWDSEHKGTIITNSPVFLAPFIPAQTLHDFPTRVERSHLTATAARRACALVVPLLPCHGGCHVSSHAVRVKMSQQWWLLGCPAGTDRKDPKSKVGCFTY